MHAPLNGSEAFNSGVPDENFSVTIAKGSGPAGSLAQFLGAAEPAVERWTFKWFEDLFASDAGSASVVNVASKIYRRVALYEPGSYTVELKYYNG